jgi:hypothetical protein
MLSFFSSTIAMNFIRSTMGTDILQGIDLLLSSPSGDRTPVT